MEETNKNGHVVYGGPATLQTNQGQNHIDASGFVISMDDGK